MEKTLQLNFNTPTGKKATLPVDEPRADLTSQSVEVAMQEIIALDLFELTGVPFATSVDARFVGRNVTELVNG